MESFFRCCSQFTEVEIRDLLLRRYSGNVEDIDVETLVELCEYAKEKEEEDRLRAEWNAVYPFMAMKWLKYMPFHEYVDARTGRNVDLRPAEEIIAEIEELHRRKEED